MKTDRVYIDCGSGVAGDMLLCALIELGLSADELSRTLHKVIPATDWRLVVERTERQAWPARQLTVEGDRFFGSGEQMKQAVRRSKLAVPVKRRALTIFDRLIRAEKEAHGGRTKGVFDPDGLGLLDTLVDVIGTSWGFWRLGFEHLSASSINTGRIAPATAQLLKEFKIPAYSSLSREELATPTGVAILSVLTQEFAPMPPMRILAAGYGAGHKDIPRRPNVLAIYKGESVASPQPSPYGRGRSEAAGEAVPREPVVLLETVIDDMDPRLYPHVTDLVMKQGALDAWWISAGMKKGRPGVAYSVLCRPDDEARLARLLFAETTTLGIRRLSLERWVLPRRAKGLRKIAEFPGGVKSQVEYELARQKAFSLSLPLRKLLK